MRESRRARERDTRTRGSRPTSRAGTEPPICDPLAGELATDRDDWEHRQAAENRRRYFAQAKAPKKASRIIFTAGLGFETAATKLVRAFLAGDDLILILASSGGQGKTIAATLGIWLHGHGIFIDAPALGFTSRLDRDTWERWAETGLLVIDDLGMENADDDFKSKFDWLVNRRYNAERKTIMTTNLDLDRFRDRYSARVRGRVRECGRFEELTGPDLRDRENESWGTSHGVGKAHVGALGAGGASEVQGMVPGAPSRPEEAGEFGQFRMRLVEREPERKGSP